MPFKLPQLLIKQVIRLVDKTDDSVCRGLGISIYY